LTVGLKYRLSTDADRETLVELWRTASGWDQVDAKTWAHRLIDPPFGEAAIAVAEDEESGRIMGQFAFIPSELFVNGLGHVKSFRPFAPIIREEIRAASMFGINPLNHPIGRLYLEGTRQLKRRGYRLMWAVPDPSWMRIFRLLPFLERGSFPLWSRPLPLERPLEIPAGYSVGPIAAWDERVDRLWERASTLHGVGLVRNSRTLPWKVGGGDYTVTTAERDGELVGLVASRAKGDRQWLICDMLAADAEEALGVTLRAAINDGNAEALRRSPEAPVRKAAILVTSTLEPTLRRLGFARDEYDFPIIRQRLDKTLPKEPLSFDRWYVSATD
jgi:hypothetical protein